MISLANCENQINWFFCNSTMRWFQTKTGCWCDREKYDRGHSVSSVNNRRFEADFCLQGWHCQGILPRESIIYILVPDRARNGRGRVIMNTLNYTFLSSSIWLLLQTLQFYLIKTGSWMVSENNLDLIWLWTVYVVCSCDMWWYVELYDLLIPIFRVYNSMILIIARGTLAK